MEANPMTEALALERTQAEWVFAKGTVKSIALGHGTGCISADEGDDDLPFRVASVAWGLELLAAGTRVEFVVDEGAHGLEAYEIVPLEAPRQ